MAKPKWVTVLQNEDPTVIEINQGPFGLSLTVEDAEEVLYELQIAVSFLAYQKFMESQKKPKL